MAEQYEKAEFLFNFLMESSTPEGGLTLAGQIEAKMALDGLNELLDEREAADAMWIDENDPRWLAAEQAVFDDDPRDYPGDPDPTYNVNPPPPAPARGTPEYWANFFGYRIHC